MLSLHDHLTYAISHLQVSCRCLLDLFAAFDTLNHFILLNCLSTSFGISELPLQWFTSYLSSRTAAVSIPPHLSFRISHLQSSTSSVLGHILFNMHNTPLSTLISISFISHLLYADETQLFISYIPKNFLTAISYLESTISLISSWMTSNYFTLNPSKTEFLLPQQTSKIIIFFAPASTKPAG